MPGKKSVHGTVTRTTRTIIVQEISDTFETESLENTVVRTTKTQEEDADASQPRQNPTHPTAAEDGELGTVDPKTAVHVLSGIDLDLASRVQTTIQTVTEASKESCNVTKTTRTDTTTTSGREGVDLTTENELQTMRKNSKSKVTDEFQQTTHLFQNKITPANLCKEDGPQKASQDLVPSQRTSHLFQNKVTPDIISDLESDSVTPKSRRHSVVQAKMMAVATTAVEMRRRAPKALQHQDELKTITETRLYSVFNPVLLCMKVAGIFYVARRVTQGSTVLDAMRNLSWQQIHCMTTVLILLVNFLRSLTTFEGQNTFGNLLFFKLMVCIFFYESFSSSLLAYLTARRGKNSIENLFITVDSICYADGIIPYEEALRFCMKCVLASTFVLGGSNVCITGYGMFASNPDVQQLFDIYLRPASQDLSGIFYFKVFLLLITTLNTIVTTLSLTFYVIVCYVLYKEFEYLRRTLATKITVEGYFSDDLEKFRLRHQKRCHLVEEADQLFKFYIANTYLTNIPLLCLLLFGIVYTPNFANRLISAFRCVYVMTQVLTVTISATIINTQAHAPLADIYTIKVEKSNGTRHLEVGMFLSRLTETIVGLTAWDMFVINKPALLTVIGVVATYFFLLVQCQAPQTSISGCNCTFVGYNGTFYNFPGSMPASQSN